MKHQKTCAIARSGSSILTAGNSYLLSPITTDLKGGPIAGGEAFGWLRGWLTGPQRNGISAQAAIQLTSGWVITFQHRELGLTQGIELAHLLVPQVVIKLGHQRQRRIVVDFL